MDQIRNLFDRSYDLFKPLLFYLTKRDPETAHNIFVKFAQALHELRLEKFVLDNEENELESPIEISNAAGLNKNGEIPPSFLAYLGFDRVVIGTVTYEPWKGNERPRCKRYESTASLVNWLGLPGHGVKKVAERIIEYRDPKTPITINVMATPSKKGDDALEDIKYTIEILRHFQNIDRFELNISCPNTHSSNGAIDARSEYQKNLDDMLRITDAYLLESQELDVKLSPDLDERGIKTILEVASDHRIHGFTIGNTTTNHDEYHIPKSPGKGGASGNAVYAASLKVQQMFYEEMRRQGRSYRINACGGINSIIRAKQRVDYGATGIQVYTPLIFTGPKLVRYLRRGLVNVKFNEIKEDIERLVIDNARVQ